MFCIYLRTNSDLCHLQHKLTGFYNRDENSLLRGTNWVFKQGSLRFVFKGLTQPVRLTRYLQMSYTHSAGTYFANGEKKAGYSKNLVVDQKLKRPRTVLIPALHALWKISEVGIATGLQPGLPGNRRYITDGAKRLFPTPNCVDRL